jgi:hypothetical protein
MATAGRTIAQLLDESKELELRAHAIQGDRELMVNAGEIDEVVSDYQEWFARAVNVLPTEYEDRFRHEYEGSWHSHKIRSFFASPGDVSLLWSEEVADSPIPYWQNPYESDFKAPLMNQRQILAEAREQLEGAGQASQDLDILERICRRFGEFLAPLASRGRERPPFVVEDEYDVQTGLHAVLCVFFDDVRPEDFTPERAGARSRVDFLLKAERIVVETKMTRSGLGARQIGEELIIDIERYKAHPECGALVALVYDPDRLITNRRALEQDLSRTHDGLIVRVFVVQ